MSWEIVGRCEGLGLPPAATSPGNSAAKLVMIKKVNKSNNRRILEAMLFLLADGFKYCPMFPNPFRFLESPRCALLEQGELPEVVRDLSGMAARFMGKDTSLWSAIRPSTNG